ncbi:hypothetical protein C8A05DRAFT_36003 [Staphylotrichum tortipilum]|uniref:Ribosomal RNA methyltransferase FtsJ domain-containing protein n=1 Tax=Staphylotrichum tortipilum TaxID=2831512 RepID=A0AAN6MHM0_9PEZI|nr:hypothetical protein C8A05DRAFT_36003 [Staphylotrichum longicolle]
MPPDANAAPRVRPKSLVQEYLLEQLPVYRELRELREQGWQNKTGDIYFENRRQRADNANAIVKIGFFKLMRRIGLELDAMTAALTIQGGGNSRPAILDLCMAPGGFSSAALYRNPSALLRGISLPPSLGGHEMLLKKPWSETDPDAQIFVSFCDITLLADEMGTPVPSIPASHPDAASFSSDRPFLEQKFDLVVCDGQVLHTHERLEYRENFEASRLLTSQLVLALQRIRSGGTMVILLHKADAWASVLLMYTFATFSDHLRLFKPQNAHRMRSSFYLVATGVRQGCEAAVEAVRQWKAKWRMATFGVGDGGEEGLGEGELEVLESGGEEKAKAVLQEIGPALVRMAEPVFAIQAEALRNASWMKSAPV